MTQIVPDQTGEETLLKAVTEDGKMAYQPLPFSDVEEKEGNWGRERECMGLLTRGPGDTQGQVLHWADLRLLQLLRWSFFVYGNNFRDEPLLWQFFLSVNFRKKYG